MCSLSRFSLINYIVKQYIYILQNSKLNYTVEMYFTSTILVFLPQKIEFCLIQCVTFELFVKCTSDVYPDMFSILCNL